MHAQISTLSCVLNIQLLALQGPCHNTSSILVLVFSGDLQKSIQCTITFVLMWAVCCQRRIRQVLQRMLLDKMAESKAGQKYEAGREELGSGNQDAYCASLLFHRSTD